MPKVTRIPLLNRNPIGVNTIKGQEVEADFKLNGKYFLDYVLKFILL